MFDLLGQNKMDAKQTVQEIMNGCTRGLLEGFQDTIEMKDSEISNLKDRETELKRKIEELQQKPYVYVDEDKLLQALNHCGFNVSRRKAGKPAKSKQPLETVVTKENDSISFESLRSILREYSYILASEENE